MSVTSGGETRNYRYDAKGSIVNDGVREFSYNQNSRLICAAQNSAVSGEYIYNSLGQRAVKKAGGETTVFLYDLSGNLIAKADETGEILNEYVWLGGTLLAAVRKGMSAIEATVDFDPDTLNLTSSKGRWVTCYIELPEEYDAADILCDTVKLNGAVPCEKSDTGDYDKDGIPDIMVKFDREKVAGILQPADAVTVTVDGMAGGVRFTGTDVIRVIDEGKGKVKKAGIPAAADAGYAPDNAETTAVYYFHCDHLGTPQAVTDESGSIVWKADYKPFGEVTLSASSIENDFRFPGQYFDTETGLHYNWFRYYDPKIGRYLKSDPIGLAGGMNLFAYALNNSVNMKNPSGLFSTYAHEVITSYVLAEFTTNQNIINRINEGNIYVDRLSNQLNNNQHGMRDVEERRYEAELDSMSFQNNQLERAAESANRGDCARALFELGQGLHSIQDVIAHDFITLPGHANPGYFYRDVYPTEEQFDIAVEGSRRYIRIFVRMLENSCECLN